MFIVIRELSEWERIFTDQDEGTLKREPYQSIFFNYCASNVRVKHNRNGFGETYFLKYDVRGFPIV